MKHSSNSATKLVKTENGRSPESSKLEDSLEEDVDGSKPVTGLDTTRMGCGFGRCRPRFLQFFANPIIFMIILNIYCLVEGAIVSGK